MLDTHNDLPKDTRKRVIKLLQARLSDAIDLQSQAKQAHWNVRGPNFIALHELFDRVYEALGEAADELAERIGQLGSTCEGTVRAAAKGSSLSEYPLDITEGKSHVKALAKALGAFGAKVRSAIDEAAKLGDADTADIFTEISRAADKNLWFVEAHMQTGA